MSKITTIERGREGWPVDLAPEWALQVVVEKRGTAVYLGFEGVLLDAPNVPGDTEGDGRYPVVTLHQMYSRTTDLADYSRSPISLDVELGIADADLVRKAAEAISGAAETIEKANDPIGFAKRVLTERHARLRQSGGLSE